MPRTILFAVGGTGGHVFPALAVADELARLDPSLSIVFAGGGLKNSDFFAKQPYPYFTLSSSTLSVRNPRKIPRSLYLLAKGFRESASLIKKQSPSLVIGFGSYYSLPLLLAARWKRLPYVLHEQNTIPGKVVRAFSRGAQFTGIHFPESSAYLKGEHRVVGMPLRKEFKGGAGERQAALEYFSLSEDQPVVLIFGGSQGAVGINRLIFEGLESGKLAPCQIIHFTGSPEASEKHRQLYRTLGIRSCVKDYEERMDFAWEAADLAVCRAGASSLAEQLAMDVPGILIPYPYAMDNHQDCNADYFVREIKGGEKFTEGPGKGVDLIACINRSFSNVERWKTNIRERRSLRDPCDFAGEVHKLLS